MPLKTFIMGLEDSELAMTMSLLLDGTFWVYRYPSMELTLFPSFFLEWVIAQFLPLIRLLHPKETVPYPLLLMFSTLLIEVLWSVVNVLIKQFWWNDASKCWYLPHFACLKLWILHFGTYDLLLWTMHVQSHVFQVLCCRFVVMELCGDWSSRFNARTHFLKDRVLLLL